MEAYPRPLVIGLLGLDPYASPAQWHADRAVVEASAEREGYSLLEIFEVTGEGWVDDATYSAVEGLATRAGAVALMTRGSVSRKRVAQIAGRCGLTVAVT